MSAAKRRIKATKPLLAYDGADALPQYASERDLRDDQAHKWIGQFVAFDYTVDGKKTRVVGRCVDCVAVPRMEADEIPDFRFTVASIFNRDKETRIRMLDTRAHVYPTIEGARNDALLRLEVEQ